MHQFPSRPPRRRRVAITPLLVLALAGVVLGLGCAVTGSPRALVASFSRPIASSAAADGVAPEWARGSHARRTHASTHPAGGFPGAAASSADSGAADGGAPDGGAADGGVADGGAADGAAADGGAADGSGADGAADGLPGEGAPADDGRDADGPADAASSDAATSQAGSAGTAAPARSSAPQPATRSTPAPAPPTTATGSAVPAPAAGATSTAVESEVLALVNQQRATAGCRPLTASPALTALARAHSADMRDRHFFGHTNPDGLDPFQRAQRAGISTMRAENIAMGQQTPAAVMTAWMNSPGHRANILNCSLTTLGVGTATGSGGPWWTQDFGV